MWDIIAPMKTNRCALTCLLTVLLATPLCAATPAEVPLRIDVPEGLQVGLWPVTFGVPFPKGALKPGAPVAVTANGKPVPTQTVPLATWDREGKSIRWLLVDFQVDAAAAKGTDYRLHFGAAAPVPAAAKPLRVERDGHHLVVDTGAGRFAVRDGNGFRIESVRV